MSNANPYDDPKFTANNAESGKSGVEEGNPYDAFDDPNFGKKPEQDGNIARGFKTAMRQVPQTFGGAAALVGDAVGSKGLNEWGMDVYNSQEQKIQKLSRDNDSWT